MISRLTAEGINCYGRLDAEPDEIEVAVTP